MNLSVDLRSLTLYFNLLFAGVVRVLRQYVKMVAEQPCLGILSVGCYAAYGARMHRRHKKPNCGTARRVVLAAVLQKRLQLVFSEIQYDRTIWLPPFYKTPSA